ncbi:hypothetical protein BDP67DRAFT_134498 [Colletotrichum lupini]|nr:hypothetical protein BDP67DRAFT_134498 [Colletotrichum lupini]
MRDDGPTTLFSDLQSDKHRQDWLAARQPLSDATLSSGFSGGPSSRCSHSALRRLRKGFRGDEIRHMPSWWVPHPSHKQGAQTFPRMNGNSGLVACALLFFVFQVESGRVLRGMAGIAWSIRSMGGEPVKAAPHMGRPAAAYRGSPRPSHSAGAFPLAIGISPQRCTAGSTLYRCQPLLLLRDATARYRSHSRMAPVPSRIAYAQGLWTETGTRDYPRPGGKVGQ